MHRGRRAHRRCRRHPIRDRLRLDFRMPWRRAWKYGPLGGSTAEAQPSEPRPVPPWIQAQQGVGWQPWAEQDPDGRTARPAAAARAAARISRGRRAKSDGWKWGSSSAWRFASGGSGIRSVGGLSERMRSEFRYGLRSRLHVFFWGCCVGGFLDVDGTRWIGFARGTQRGPFGLSRPWSFAGGARAGNDGGQRGDEEATKEHRAHGGTIATSWRSGGLGRVSGTRRD